MSKPKLAVVKPVPDLNPIDEASISIGHARAVADLLNLVSCPASGPGLDDLRPETVHWATHCIVRSLERVTELLDDAPRQAVSHG